MNMATVTFDTLEAVRRLKEAGYEEKQAEAIVRVIGQALITMQKIHFIRAQWDAEAQVWVATSDDVAGLATEAQTLKELSDKLDSMVPELLQLNEGSTASVIPF